MARVLVVPARIGVELREEETILDGLRRHGYTHRFGCRRGGCGQCRIHVLDGRVGHRAAVAAEVLSPQERGSGVALSCRAVPDGDCTIRVPDDRLTRFLPWVPAPQAGAPDDGTPPG